MPNQHVVPHSEGWALRPEGASKDTQVFRTQEQAIQRGREVATNQRSELLIHNRESRIRERNSYGNDPYPPRG
jgi:hypothetical protein